MTRVEKRKKSSPVRASDAGCLWGSELCIVSSFLDLPTSRKAFEMDLVFDLFPPSSSPNVILKNFIVHLDLSTALVQVSLTILRHSQSSIVKVSLNPSEVSIKLVEITAVHQIYASRLPAAF